MRYLALTLGLLGLFLLYLSFLSSPHNFSPPEEEHAFVLIEGQVTSERLLFDQTSLLVVGGNEVICTCDQSYKGKDVRVTGVVEFYNGRAQVRAYFIQVIDIPSS